MNTFYRQIIKSLAVIVAAAPLLAMQPAMAAPQPAAQNSKLELLDRNNTVLLLVDHQVGLLTGVRDTSVTELKHNVIGMVKAAKALGVPVIVTAVQPDGPFGSIFPELLAAAPDLKIIPRTTVNAWADENVRKAVEATGRKKIVISGVSLEVCAGFPALTAKRDGYDTYVVLDASGTFNPAKHEAGVQRLTQAGVILTDYATVGVELLGDNTDPKAHDVYGALDMPFVSLVYQLYHPKK